MIPRSQLIERSMRCFTLGALAFIPAFGLVAGILSVRDFFASATQSAERWNPARSRLYVGLAMALLGILLNVAAAALICLFLIRRIADGE